MSGQTKHNATQRSPAETQREVVRQQTRAEETRRPPTMIPGVANPQTVTDGANFYSRVYRPHSKRWVRVSVWIFFIILPSLFALLGVFNLVRQFVTHPS